MRVLFRMAPFPSGKSPYSSEDKLTMVKGTLRSFVNGFMDVDPVVTFILDSCPKVYKEAIKEIVLFQHDYIDMQGAGNFGTYAKQIEIASQLHGDELVLFQEDDYLYLANSGRKIIDALEAYDSIFVTPQDEYFYYFDEPRHVGKYNIEVINGYHWREVKSTTLTFATRAQNIKDNAEMMLSHNIWDYPMWQEMRQRGYEIWAPIPTLATHLVKDILAPCVDWDKEWRKVQ